MLGIERLSLISQKDTETGGREKHNHVSAVNVATLQRLIPKKMTQYDAIPSVTFKIP